jgi:hypothetical protein
MKDVCTVKAYSLDWDTVACPRYSISHEASVIKTDGMGNLLCSPVLREGVQGFKPPAEPQLSVICQCSLARRGCAFAVRNIPSLSSIACDQQAWSPT